MDDCRSSSGDTCFAKVGAAGGHRRGRLLRVYVNSSISTSLVHLILLLAASGKCAAAQVPWIFAGSITAG